MSTDHDDLRRLLGGYLLGGLDDADTDRLDAHLLQCDECRAYLERLSPVPELLRSLEDAPPIAVPPGTRPSAVRIEGLLARMRAERTQERRRIAVRLLAVAAVVTLVAAAAVGVTLGRDEDQPAGPTVAGPTVLGSPAAAPSQPLVTAVFEPAAEGGLAGQAVLTGKTWGVSIDLTMSRLSGRGPFTCRVRNAEGATEQAAIWGPTPSGNAKVTGASSIPLRNVSEVAVADHDGHVLGTAHLN